MKFFIIFTINKTSHETIFVIYEDTYLLQGLITRLITRNTSFRPQILVQCDALLL